MVRLEPFAARFTGAAASQATSGAGGSQTACRGSTRSAERFFDRPQPLRPGRRPPRRSRSAPTGDGASCQRLHRLPGAAAGSASSISAATAAAWGAAAEVPQKRQKPLRRARRRSSCRSRSRPGRAWRCTPAGPSGAAGASPFDRAEVVGDRPPRGVGLGLGVGVEGAPPRPRSRWRRRCGRRSSGPTTSPPLRARVLGGVDAAAVLEQDELEPRRGFRPEKRLTTSCTVCRSRPTFVCPSRGSRPAAGSIRRCLRCRSGRRCRFASSR